MSRQRLQAALTSRTPGDGAVAPLIGAHAARLEQVPESMFLTDPETQARCLRNCQALYGTDAVTIGAGADSLAIAARIAAEPARDALTARAAIRESLALETLPEPDAVIEQSVIGAETGAIERLRPVLGERAGIAVVFADSQSLARQLGDDGGAPLCAALLLRAVRLYCDAVAAAATKGRTGAAVASGADVGEMAEPPAEAALEDAAADAGDAA